MKVLYTLFLTLSVVLLSCAGGNTATGGDGDTLKMAYSKLLTIVKNDDYTKVVIADPWHNGKTLHTYFLVEGKSGADKAALGKEGTVVEVPLKRSMPFTTVHCEMICSDFAKTEAIAGVADLQYIKVEQVQQGVKAGKIKDCGNSMQPDIEKIMDTNPDAILVSPFENSGGYGKLESLGIPLIEVADYMEVSPLARVEWLRFYGLLYGCEDKAEAVIKDVVKNYQSVVADAQKLQQHPTVLMDKISGGTWYVPGGQSTIGTMLKDGGADYFYSKDSSSGSLALPFERVLSDSGDAQCWLLRYSSDKPLTYDALLSENQGYSQFVAFKNKNVFGCNVEKTRFYEETSFHPDRLLRDIYDIMKGDTSKLRYFAPVID